MRDATTPDLKVTDLRMHLTGQTVRVDLEGVYSVAGAGWTLVAETVNLDAVDPEVVATLHRWACLALVRAQGVSPGASLDRALGHLREAWGQAEVSQALTRREGGATVDEDGPDR
jgi:hypothetical protein